MRDLVLVLSKAGVPHAFGGALASGCHGLPSSTMYVDVMLIASPDEMKRLTGLVLAAGFEKVKSASQTAAEEKFVAESTAGYRVDISQAKTEHDVEAVKRAVKIRAFDVDIWVMAPENFVLQKLVLGRPKDIKDALAVLTRQSVIIKKKKKLDVEYMDGWASKLNVSGELKELMGKVK